jgi:hypothetical protein
MYSKVYTIVFWKFKIILYLSLVNFLNFLDMKNHLSLLFITLSCISLSCNVSLPLIWSNFVLASLRKPETIATV